MSIEIIESLTLVDVLDHGKPNLERVSIYVQQPCDLSAYCLFLTMPEPLGPVAPVRDHMLWFGNGLVNTGDWIFVYTASGSTTITNGAMTAGSSIQPRIINIHWGKEHTVFQNRAVSPLLIRIGALAALPPPPPAYQGNPGGSPSRLY